MSPVHQPLVLTSSSGRNDEISSPAVGIVHITAMTTAAREAQGDDSAFLADEEAVSRATVLSTETSGSAMVIGPPAFASDGRCR